MTIRSAGDSGEMPIVGALIYPRLRLGEWPDGRKTYKVYGGTRRREVPLESFLTAVRQIRQHYRFTVSARRRPNGIKQISTDDEVAAFARRSETHGHLVKDVRRLAADLQDKWRAYMRNHRKDPNQENWIRFAVEVAEGFEPDDPRRAETFNAYLEGEGISDVLDVRQKTGKLDHDAVERYSKHVKAVYQAGEARSGGWDRSLGFPAELVPLTNPYELAVGDELGLRSFVHGKPVANQIVIAGGDRDGKAIEEREVRTDDDGVVRFVLDRPGKWYVKFIHLVESEEEQVDYESNWATISFEVR